MILLTGGAGYIGSHTTLALLQAGHNVMVLDNLCNSSAESLKRVAQLAGCAPVFVQGDIRDRALLARLFAEHSVDAVLHFAGLKAVGESVAQPLRYYDNNVHGSQVLLQACADAGVFNFVFSSSATVYGEPAHMPIFETCPVGQPTNPYGRSKLHIEEMLNDIAASDPAWRVVCLRYFNPVGAHESGLIGENPHGVPNNLMPYIAQVAVGQRAELKVFGSDYPTSDGTGVRDYIHVMDLVEGHAAALAFLSGTTGWHAINLGTGKGYSVLEMVQAFEKASGRQVPYKVVARRAGDLAACYADPQKASEVLSWRATRTLDDMCASTWQFQQSQGLSVAS
jgi:UDP-glucose 4-epimerase